jgi:hypothetical protein
MFPVGHKDEKKVWMGLNFKSCRLWQHQAISYFGVRVNQHIRFPPNVNDFPLSASPPPCLLALRETYNKRKAESGKRKAESGKRKAESGKHKEESRKQKAESRTLWQPYTFTRTPYFAAT